MKSIDKYDVILRKEFEKYREKIDDDGFTRNVMNKIPMKDSFFNPRDIFITICLIVGAVFSIPAILEGLFAFQNIYTFFFLLCCFAGTILSIVIAADPENNLI